ncbi:BMP family ABC transporter substrate-binding protein [Macrococcus armenti]|uniref:BMP family ABC transporter substrate-binding protein n=1 Tax=Macrococcus armenti TaxID=2875764 RepID=UPI001CC94870|nr:BMP family ABC transporter substrate-binding protein [Macrococcus armenti]UBH09284.1 BMP family ABC transporter substrate-binding protein [Macrococcus armenti]UBH11579.1 BMP family ABC transporter substrate-binding protein [Macrococcus armenti]
MKYKITLFIIVIALVSLCIYSFLPKHQEIKSVGYLSTESIHDQTWGTEGYKGVLNIIQMYDANFYIQENLKSDQAIMDAIDQFAARDVSIVYGQGSEFQNIFNKAAKKYPKMHFVFLNGKSKAKNVSALNIEGYAMGFFGGMLAAHESKTKVLGVVGAFKGQPEIDGFIDGAKYEHKETKVIVKYVNTWGYSRDAQKYTLELIKSNYADVIYPAADGTNRDVMEVVKVNHKKAIGYISDQRYLGDFVIGSTTQNISKLYSDIAEDYYEHNLIGGNKLYGMGNEIADLTGITQSVDKDFVNKLDDSIRAFKVTNILPNKKMPPTYNNNAYITED